jgi:hypothetical protein
MLQPSRERIDFEQARHKCHLIEADAQKPGNETLRARCEIAAPIKVAM